MPHIDQIHFFKQLGRFFFSRARLWILLALLIVPFSIGLSTLLLRYVNLCKIEKTFDTAALRGRSALEKRSLKDNFLHRYTHFEPYFITQNLEALLLRQTELAHLRAMINHPATSNREALQQRIALLDSMANRLSFAEENTRSSKRVKETEERLLHRVEIDSDDLEQLLCLIESVPIGPYTPYPKSPQLLIEDFFMSKKGANIYEIDLTILKREFHEKKN